MSFNKKIIDYNFSSKVSEYNINANIQKKTAKKLCKIFVENIFLWLFIPGVDMLRVFILRLCKKKNPFSPDRSHLHYILLDNIGYKKTILFFILVVSVSIFISEVYNFLILPVLLFNTLIYSYILMRFNNKRIFAIGTQKPYSIFCKETIKIPTPCTNFIITNNMFFHIVSNTFELFVFN